MRKTIQRHVMENWDRLFPDAARPDALHTLQVSQSHNKDFSMGRIVHLLFAGVDDRPVAVAKFCRDGSYERSIENEARLMREISASPLRGGVPALLDTAVLGGRLVMFEEAAPGVPMSLHAQEAFYRLEKGGEAFKGLVRGHFRKAGSFIKEMRAVAASGGGAGGGEFWDEAGPVIAKYVDMLGITGAEEYLAFGLGRAAEQVLGKESGAHLAHMDFIPSNLFLAEEVGDGGDGGAVGVKVIDWEFSRVSRMGFIDTMRFVYYYFNLLNRHGALGEDASFDTFVRFGNWFSEAAMEFAAEVEGPALNDEDAFRTLLGLSLVYEATLQVEVVGGVEITDIPPIRNAVNLLSGLHSLREREMLKGEVKALKEQAEEQERRIGEKERRIAELGRANGALDQERRRLDTELNSMLGSKSWRITYPLRWVTGTLKGIKPG